MISRPWKNAAEKFQTLEKTEMKFSSLWNKRTMNSRMIFRTGAFVLSGLLLVGCVSSDRAASDADTVPEGLALPRACDESVNLLSGGKQGEAEEVIDAALAVDMGSAELLFAKAVLRRSRWVKMEALYYFSQLIHGFPLTVEAKAAELSVLLDAGVEVEKNLGALIRLSDGNPDNLYLLWLSAVQCREQDKGAQGHWRYTKLLEQFEVGPVMVHHTVANILTEKLKQYDEAMVHRRAAVSMESRGWSLQGLANTLSSMGSYEESCDVWAKCLAMEPDNDLYWYQWGCVLFKMKLYEQALEKFSEAVQLNSEQSWCFYQMALCNKRLGNRDEMEAQLRRVLELGSNQFAVKLVSSLEGGLDVEENLAKVMGVLDEIALVEQARELAGLGSLYERGFGVSRDVLKAVEMYREAAGMGNEFAAIRLADCYAAGRGVEKNDDEAFRLYKQAAENGNLEGLVGLGDCYHYGYGVEQSPKEAVRWYQKAAEQTNTVALMRLADCYEKGAGIEQNDEKAQECYRKVIEKSPSHKEARKRLKEGGLYAELINAAERGDAVAQRKLGFEYQWGDAAFRNPLLAVRWYRAAADQNDVDALWRLARCYADGTGTAVNEPAALACFERSLSLAPEHLTVWFSFARFLATCENDGIRDQKRATVLAEKAVAKLENVTTLNVLSQVYAAGGRYEDALETARRLAAFWEKTYADRDLPPLFAERLKEYEQKAGEQR